MTPGIPDNMFLRGSVPMTKADVRALTICRARLAPNQTVWEVGAGTGSVTVEAALRVPGGRIYAVEEKAEAAALTAENCRLFGTHNVTVVHGRAPEALLGLPRPHRVMVGGSRGELAEIIRLCGRELLPGGVIVVNAIRPATLQLALDVLSLPPFGTPEGVLVQVSGLERLGDGYHFRAQNPVWIICAGREG